MESIICTSGLTKIYRIGQTRIQALRDVDLEIKKGEFCAFTGTSGSGKSTLLNMLAGLERPTRGQIVVGGQHIEKLSENRLVVYRQKQVGFIFQSFNLMPHLTALENVALPMIFCGISPAARRRRAIKTLQSLGLSKHLRHRPTQLSGGQQQRVAIARAVVTDPDIIFADEPTGNLDSHTSREILTLLKSLSADQGRTVVMVTHDINYAQLADRMIKLSDGSIVDIIENKQGEISNETNQMA
jgi:putative ABC transport system ATP-binding protein